MYGQKVKYAETIDDSPPLHAVVITRVHSIFGALLFYARAVNDKIIVALIDAVYATLLIKVKSIMTRHDVSDVTSASLLCLRHAHRAAAHADKRHSQ